jgi:hypothetical protein
MKHESRFTQPVTRQMPIGVNVNKRRITQQTLYGACITTSSLTNLLRR